MDFGARAAHRKRLIVNKIDKIEPYSGRVRVGASIGVPVLKLYFGAVVLFMQAALAFVSQSDSTQVFMNRDY
jgi:hypothetical protein